MSDNANDADQIRLKRLERLQAAQATQSEGANPSTSSSPVASSSSASAAPVRASHSSVPSAASPVHGAAASPVLSKKAPSSIAASRSSTPLAKSSATSTPQPRVSPIPTQKPQPSSSSAAAHLSIPYPQWLSGTISRILQVTLSQSRAESSNWSTTYLYTLHDELVEEAGGAEVEGTLRFDEDNLERAIVARLSLDPAQMVDDEEAEKNPVALTVLAGLPADMTNLEYLVGCWRRWHTERTRFGNPKQADPEVLKRSQSLEYIKQKLLEGIGLQLQEPELFPQPAGKTLGGEELVPPLLQLPRFPCTPALSLDEHQVITLLTELAAAYSSTGSPEEVVDIIGVPVVQKVIDKLGAKSSSIQAMLAAINGANAGATPAVMDLTGSDWRAVVRVINDLAEVKSLGAMFTEMPNWFPKEATPSTIEIESLLGPAMRLSCFNDAFPSIAKEYFAQPSTLSKEVAEASSNALRSTLGSLQGLLFSIFNNIVRSGARHREAVLALFSHVIKLNMKRDGMQVDPRTVSSDGFMINTFSVLMDFSTPFMDFSYSKIDKIDPEYFRKSARLNIEDVTKINATGEEAKEYYHGYQIPENVSPPNFISEIFFLATSFMHYGLYPAFNKHEQLYRQLRYMREDLQEAENNHQFDGTPQEAAFQQQVARLKASTEGFHSRVYAAEVQLLDPGFIAKTSNFCSFVMSWLVRLVDPKGKHPLQEISLSDLPESTPVAFKMLPEYFIEDVTEFYFFVSRYAPQTMIDMQKDQLLVFIVVFLYTPYVKNPYLKGKFVEILYRNTRSWGPRFPRGTLGDTLNYHPLALKGLLPALMRIYCEIEFTGQHNQFYEKFEVRHQIAKVLKLIWETKEHREAFKAETGKEDFVRFVNYLLNDTTFLLDESLSKLKTIHDLQLEMADKANWDAQTAEEKKDKEKLFKSAEGQATSFLIYTYEVLHLLKTLTVEAPDPFLRSEIVDRLAASLDFNLNVLAGPRCQELRVQDKEKYKFKPRELLGDIMQIIINLANKDRYVIATAKDGRSYSKALFDNAMRIAGRAGLKTEPQLQLLRRMVTEIEVLKAQEEEEEEMEETPDEFLDPLTAEIMEDPVLLPSSNTIIDYSTIKQHLLTVQQDPFNRSPLTIDQVVRDDKLRGEIEAFREQRRQDRLNRLQAARHAEQAQSEQADEKLPESEDAKMEE